LFPSLSLGPPPPSPLCTAAGGGGAVPKLRCMGRVGCAGPRMSWTRINSIAPPDWMAISTRDPSTPNSACCNC
jgi:hypothetical protein